MGRPCIQTAAGRGQRGLRPAARPPLRPQRVVGCGGGVSCRLTRRRVRLSPWRGGFASMSSHSRRCVFQLESRKCGRGVEGQTCTGLARSCQTPGGAWRGHVRARPLPHSLWARGPSPPPTPRLCRGGSSSALPPSQCGWGGGPSAGGGAATPRVGVCMSQGVRRALSLHRGPPAGCRLNPPDGLSGLF